jgi:hypothetical protein
MFHAARSALLAVSLLVPVASGCTATVVESDVVYVPQRRVVVFQDAPTLVYVGDGIYVVRDYDTAVYFVNGSYYYCDGGVWFSSPYWNSPWTTTTVSFVPVGLHHRVHHHYVHYHGDPGAQIVRAPSRDLDHRPASPSREAAAPHPIDGGSNHGESQARKASPDYRLASSDSPSRRADDVSRTSAPSSGRATPTSDRGAPPSSRTSTSTSAPRTSETRAPRAAETSSSSGTRASAGSSSSPSRAKPAAKSSSGSRSSAPRAPSKQSRSRSR